MRTINKGFSDNSINRNYPKTLIRTFIVFAFIAVTSVMLFVNYGVYKVFQKETILEAEKDATRISTAIYELEQDFISTTDVGGNYTLGLAEDEFEEFDKRMRKYLSIFNAVKMKIFSLEGIIIYSTDHSIIGQNGIISDHASGEINEKLHRALLGEVVSKLEKKHNVWDLKQEKKFDLDIVETYVPIKLDKYHVVGSFELYLDISHHSKTQQDYLKTSIILTAIILAVILGFMFILLMRGVNRLNLISTHIQNTHQVHLSEQPMDDIDETHS
ncbi:MAG: hypothetical protein ISR96_06620 [Nitrospira sp.]|nr:hypothetical protein [bacterium]MBL7049168.1 hypothetical protein [Nitrospira sp.]